MVLHLLTMALFQTLTTNLTNRIIKTYCATNLPNPDEPENALVSQKENTQKPVAMATSSRQTRWLPTCSPGKKACSESIQVFISCPLNMFTFTYSGGSPSPSLQASRLAGQADQATVRRLADGPPALLLPQPRVIYLQWHQQ